MLADMATGWSADKTDVSTFNPLVIIANFSNLIFLTERNVLSEVVSSVTVDGIHTYHLSSCRDSHGKKDIFYFIPQGNHLKNKIRIQHKELRKTTKTSQI